MRTIRVLMVDDSPVFLESAQKLLSREPDIEIVGLLPSARQALEQVRELRPDLILMDLCMPEMDGLEATRRLKANDAALRIVIITLTDDAVFRVAAHHDGADGFLSKMTLSGELAPLIRKLCG